MRLVHSERRQSDDRRQEDRRLFDRRRYNPGQIALFEGAPPIEGDGAETVEQAAASLEAWQALRESNGAGEHRGVLSRVLGR